jgi:hypothetical protein
MYSVTSRAGGRRVLAALVGLLAVLVVVGVAGAAAPTVQQAKLTAADGDTNFGHSIAVSGGTIVIGASGSAYVFERDATGQWTQRARLTPETPSPFSDFGSSVGVSGSTILVGDRGHAAYVYVRSGDTWTQQARLTAADGSEDDFFGVSVALSGDTAVVGAQLDDTAAGSNAGSAYVFERHGALWTQSAKLEAADATSEDGFGFAVSTEGARIAVSAIEDVRETAGSVYVFERSGTTWTQRAKLIGNDPSQTIFFGASLGVSGSTILVGAPVSDRLPAPSPSPPPTGLGTAHVFTDSNGTWSRQAILQADDGFTEDLFGISAALDGDTAIVTASADDDNGQNSGSAYVFTRDQAGVWSQTAKLEPLDGGAGRAFGWQRGLGLWRGVAVIGSPGDPAYVFAAPGPDADGDGIDDSTDNCPALANPSQADYDGDFVGNACDADDDGDTVADTTDNCPLTPNQGQTNSDNDGLGDACDPDDDGDTVNDTTDSCPLTPNQGQTNSDNDGLGDACDPDDDGDTVADATDNCPLAPNQNQADFDNDGVGNACDPDDDNDQVLDAADICPGTVIPEPGLRKLGNNRYALVTADAVFDSGSAGGPPYTTADTAGCSATQIAVSLGIPFNQYRDGLARRTLEDWIAAH